MRTQKKKTLSAAKICTLALLLSLGTLLGQQTARAQISGQEMIGGGDGTGADFSFLDAINNPTKMVEVAKQNFNTLKDSVGLMYGLITQDDETMRSAKKLHLNNGALRSGQGTPAQIQARQNKFEELQQLEQLVEDGTVPSDMGLARKLQKHKVDLMSKKRGVYQDDSLDHSPTNYTLYLHADDDWIENSPETLVTLSDNADSMGRSMKGFKKNVDSERAINRLEEPYPSQCFNNGQLAEQTQKYYMCKPVRAVEAIREPEEIRVTQETYQKLLANYSDQFTCYTTNVVRNVCVCPRGIVDFECATATQQQCAINITEPAFYKGCTDKEDSFYYLYSIPGFSPCYHFDFSTSITVKFNLTCQDVTNNGFRVAAQRSIGYPYRDVIQEAVFNPAQRISSTPKSEFEIVNADSATLALRFRSFKYLSDYKEFSTLITDQDVLEGRKEGSVEVDFSILVDMDESSEYWFVVGGRTYFEGFLFGPNRTSFTYKGFFDQEGYEEPRSKLNFKNQWVFWSCIIGALLLLIAIIFVIKMCFKKDKNKVE